jgi:sporulation protein YlmC with PRC-barrel domain
MRKISTLLSIIVLAAFLLTACGGEETNTVAPNTTVPATEAPATDEATEVPSGTETVMPGDGSTTPSIPVTGDEGPARLSNQLDFTVWNQDGEQIGEVDDMVLDLDNTMISYVVVGTGGFLDLGERHILVPWNLLQIQTGTGDTTGGQPNAFILQTDQDTFSNAPDFDLNANLPQAGQPAGDWDADIRNYWENGVLPATAPPDGTAAPDTTATVEGTGQATATAGTDQGTDQGQVADLQGVVLASDVLGSAVTLSPGQGEGIGQGTDQGTGLATATAGTGQGQATSTPGTGTDQATATTDASVATAGPGVGNFNGTIDDMIVDTDTGDILYIVVSADFDEGQRLIPVPLSFFQWDTTNGALALNVNPAMLRDAPFFEDGQFPDTTAEGWNSEFDTFWQ